MNTSIEPAPIPGADSGTIDAKERWPGARAQVRRRFEQGGIQPLQRGVERQHHERQVAVDQAEQHRAIVIEQRQRLVDDRPVLAGPC